MTSTIKTWVSKKRRRFQKDGFDLDLTYILDNIIAMGYPGDKIEGLYRNNIDEVNHFLELKHKGHYKIYNLCEERNYNASKFETGKVAKYPFVDHNPPQMFVIPEFCHDVHEWLSKDSQNVAAVHCKAGKGRTGVMICCYLLHSGECLSATAALEFYAQKRTHDKKGVTIPSQQRYVGYYEYLLSKPPEVKYKPRPMNLTMIRLEGHLIEHSKVVLQLTLTAPDVIYTSTFFEWKHCSGKKSTASTSSSSTDSYLHQPMLENSNNSTISSSSCGHASNHVTLELEEPLLLTGDVKLQILTKPVKILKKTKLCHCWFNTFFVEAQPYSSYRNGCNNGSGSEEGHLSAGGHDQSGNNSKNGSCNSIQRSGDASTNLPYCSLQGSKRDSTSSENCCTVKVKFSKIQPDKLRAHRNAKQIDRTMSCPPPSDTVRPRLPAEWTSSYNKDPKPPDDEYVDASTQTNSPKQHYTMIFSKDGLDKAHKDKGCKTFSQDFAVHLIFMDPSDAPYHLSRSSYGGTGASSSTCSTTDSQQMQVCMKKFNKMFPDNHHRHDHTRTFVGEPVVGVPVGSMLKTTRTTSDVRSHLSSCVGSEDDRDDDPVFERHSHRHHHHGAREGASGGSASGSGGGRLNRNHSSTSSCSSTSSSSSCSDNNSSCSNSSSTENCSQLLHNNNKK